MNFSILAPGSIARKMAEAATGLSDEYKIVCHSVASRNIEKAQSFAGGALLDVGVYPINFAMMVFDRDISRVESSAVMSDKGVDESNSVTLYFRGGGMAVLHSTMMTPTDRSGIIYCEDGYIEVQNINSRNRMGA